MRLVALLVAFCVCTGCGGDDGAEELVVFAAASLAPAFELIAEQFETVHPDVDVVVSAAGSSDLAAQILEGAPADVFASADLATMGRVVEAGMAADEPNVFAANRLEILVEDGNPLGIGGLNDLAAPDLVVVVCAPEVPCGHYASTVLDNAGVDVTADSYEVSVRSVVTKVVTGEADAGLVYATDVQLVHDEADGVPIPDDVNVVAEYPIAALSGTEHPTLAAAFVEYVNDDRARAVLESVGFDTR